MIGNSFDFSFYNVPMVLENFAPCLASEALLGNLPYMKFVAKQKLGGVKIQQSVKPLHQQFINALPADSDAAHLVFAHLCDIGNDIKQRKTSILEELCEAVAENAYADIGSMIKKFIALHVHTPHRSAFRVTCLTLRADAWCPEQLIL